MIVTEKFLLLLFNIGLLFVSCPSAHSIEIKFKDEKIYIRVNSHLSIVFHSSPQDEQDQASHDYSSFPLMQSLPEVGDRIALKKVVPGDGYSFEYSDYRPAKVVAVEGPCVSLQYESEYEDEFSFYFLGKETPQRKNITKTC